MSIAEFLATINLILRGWAAAMGRVAAIAKRSQTCDLTFYNDTQSVVIHLQPPKGVAIRNAEKSAYRFEAKLTRRGLGNLVFPQGWNPGAKDRLHESPIKIIGTGIPADWLSNMTGDWIIEAWITIGSKRRATLYNGPPTHIAIGGEGATPRLS